MPKWKDLFACLLDESMTPEKIVQRLNVPPGRLRKMLRGKRLGAAISALHVVAESQAKATVGASAAAAARRLAELASPGDGPPATESTRKACADILERANQLRQSQDRTLDPYYRLADWEINRIERRFKKTLPPTIPADEDDDWDDDDY